MEYGTEMNKSKIAYDLDGVLVPDYNRIPDLTEAEFFEQTLYAKPLFNPQGNFDVVTARLEYNRPVTERWLDQLEVKPQRLLMRDSVVETPAAFKYRMIKKYKYLVYVESDAIIVDEIITMAETNLKVKVLVLHFDKFTRNSIDNSLNTLQDLLLTIK